MTISHSELKRLLRYDPEKGTWQNKKTGRHVGAIDPSKGGYRFIKCAGKRYRSAKLAWFYVKGEWPTQIVDHEDCDRTNDVFSNFRLASKSENGANAKLHAHNTTGLKGVCKIRRKFQAIITCRGSTHYLGIFDCPAAAHFAYLIAADIHFGEFARAR
jgi:hypothetical protein